MDARAARVSQSGLLYDLAGVREPLPKEGRTKLSGAKITTYPKKLLLAGGRRKDARTREDH